MSANKVSANKPNVKYIPILFRIAGFGVFLAGSSEVAVKTLHKYEWKEHEENTSEDKKKTNKKLNEYLKMGTFSGLK